jgi:hypothetical protein
MGIFEDIMDLNQTIKRVINQKQFNHITIKPKVQVLDLVEITEFYREYCETKNKELGVLTNSDKKAIDKIVALEVAKKKRFKNDSLNTDDTAVTRNRTTNLDKNVKNYTELDNEFNHQRELMIQKQNDGLKTLRGSRLENESMMESK